MKSMRCLFHRVAIGLAISFILPAHAGMSHERVSHSDGGYRHTKSHDQYKSHIGKYHKHQYRHRVGYRYEPFRWDHHYYPYGYHSSNFNYWRPGGWTLGWGTSWGSDYWSRPYSGIGLSIPFSSNVTEVKRIRVREPVSRVTTSVEYASGLSQLPANARVINVDGKTQYEWQGKRYRFDWVSQEYKLLE